MPVNYFNIIIILGGFAYLFNKEKTVLAALKFLTNPQLNQLLPLWRIIDENKIVKKFYKQNLDKIQLNQKIYIPRLFKPITLDSIFSEINQKIEDKSLIYLPGHLLLNRSFVNIFQKEKERITIRILSSLQKEQSFNQKVLNSDLVKILHKLVGNEQITNVFVILNIIQQFQEKEIIQWTPNFDLGLFQSCCGGNIRNLHQINPIQNIIIHIHGGGFIAMSSFSHQVYLRKWANSMKENTLLFSIDYRLSPESKYPFALDDCWQAYLWILYISEVYLNINIRSIILTGDSAGGNLALGVTMQAIQKGIRKPDGLFLSYPALNLNIQNQHPSALKSLNDKITNFTLLKLCLQAYSSPGIDIERDYYFCPQLYPDELLKLLPQKLMIIIGDQDWLLDDVQQFVFRIIQAKPYNDSLYPRIIVYKGLYHGFQNLCGNKFGIEAARLVVNESCQILNYMFE